MRYYPAFLDLSDRKAVVVGGGKVAERKVRSLVKAGALVEVVSPDLTTGLKTLCDQGKIRHKKRKYRSGDLRGAFIVIAATSSADVNAKVARDAKNLVNIIDMPADGNFIVPSLVRRGNLTIAISTEGVSPAISKAVRKEIEHKYDAEFARYLRFVESVRGKVIKEIKDVKKRERFLKSLASAEILAMLRNRGFGAASGEVLKALDKIK
ncbi:MAG TPA: bifunctional precorrin-2 dehydrogenase/sirohydrochlorin ferrochelatase [Nitrospirae bacterium]|nr:bifunctional precorrin-2 dehydrogenase/sirohydrochlorin ferrochelatase [Nitrospirota bacterium]